MSSYLEKLKKGMEMEEEVEAPEETVEFASENIIETEDGIQIEDIDTEEIEEEVEEKIEIIEKPKKKPIKKKKTKKKPTKEKKEPEVKEEKEELVIEETPETEEVVEEETQEEEIQDIESSEEEPEEVFSEVSFGDTMALEKEKETTLTSTKKNDKWIKPEGELAIDVYQTDKHVIVRSAIAGIKMSDINIVLEGDMLIIKGERKRPKDTEEIKDSFCQECHWGAFSRQIILPISIDEDNIEATIKNGILELRMRIINRSGQKEIKIKKA
jgi:HSP20 family protein